MFLQVHSRCNNDSCAFWHLVQIKSSVSLVALCAYHTLWVTIARSALASSILPATSNLRCIALVLLTSTGSPCHRPPLAWWGDTLPQFARQPILNPLQVYRPVHRVIQFHIDVAFLDLVGVSSLPKYWPYRLNMKLNEVENGCRHGGGNSLPCLQRVVANRIYRVGIALLPRLGKRRHGYLA